MSEIDGVDVSALVDGDDDSEDVGDDDMADYDLSANKVRDLVHYVRSNTIRNEKQFILATLGYVTGYMAENDHFCAGVLIGTSSSGKTHLQGNIEALFPPDHMYRATSGTDKSLIYDDAWEDAHIASLDELQKPSEQLIEFLKSVHGDDDAFEYKITAGDAGDGAERDVDTIVRSAMPYWFLYAQYEPDFEMWNRLMKVPVHESESKNRAVFRMVGDIRHIQIGDDENEYNYDFTAGTAALQKHIASIPEETTGYVALPNGQNVKDWAVADVIEPIFNHSRSESNRAYSMVYNLIRASALLNYPDRVTREVEFPDGEVHEAVIAEAQDVANVLACRDVLLATTHELDRKKKAICKAMKAKGTANEARIADIQEYMRESDAPLVKRTELEHILEDLRDNYLVYIHRDAGENNEDIYEFLGYAELGEARVQQYADQFANTEDPITGRNFLDAHEDIVADIKPSAADFMEDASADVSAGSTGGQQFLGGSEPSIDLAPHEERVRQHVKDALDGETVDGLDDIPLEQFLGLVPLGEDTTGFDPEGTILDPEHDVWYQMDKPESWVKREKDARREVERAIRRLIDERVILAETTEEKGEVVEADVQVLAKEDL